MANKQLTEFLEPYGYYKVTHTPGLWRHKTRPIKSTLVVDNFGVKYVGKEHADHLLSILEHHYPAVATNWKGELYCGITLKWNYAKDYVKKKQMKKRKKRVQQVVGSVFYYGKGVNMTTLTGLSTLASEQAKASEQTILNMEHLLEYLATNPDATI